MSRIGGNSLVGVVVLLTSVGWCEADVNSGSAGLLFIAEWQGQNVSIVKRDLGAGTTSTLINGTAGNAGPMPHHFGPLGIAADAANQYFYYADINGGAIRRMNFDGTGSVTLLGGVAGPEDVALDSAGGRLYWSGGGKIQRVDLTGQNAQTLVSSNLLAVSGIALDLAHSRVYWTDYHTDLIGYCDLDGGNRTNFATPGGGPIDITIDTINNKLIWADFDSDSIYRSELDGSNIEVLISTAHINLPGSLAIDPFQGHLYWNDWGDEIVRRSNLDGSNIVDVYSSPGITSLGGLAFVPEPSLLPAITGALLFIHPRRRGSSKC